jgi:hypothetical protein
MAPKAKIAVENVNKPGRTVSVDADKYPLMKAAMLAVLPGSAPGLTLVELRDRVVPRLPESLFPAGAKAGWRLMEVRLDLLAKQVIARDGKKPIRPHQTNL